MTFKNSEDISMDNLVDGAKKGDKFKRQIIVESFQGLIKNSFMEFIHEKVNIEWDDYCQECNMKIIECINCFKKKKYWQLCSLIEKSIKNRTFDFSRKNRNFDDANILCGDTIDLCNLKNINESCEFEDTVVGNITVRESYEIFIKDKLSREENMVFLYVMSGKKLEDYAKKKGVKLESVKRTFRRAMNKVRKIKELKQFHCIMIIIFTVTKDIGSYVDVVLAGICN